MMNLKEAFQAQNRINDLLGYIVRYLYERDNVMTVTENIFATKLWLVSRTRMWMPAERRKRDLM